MSPVEQLIDSAIRLGIHSRGCVAGSGADPYEEHDACPTCAASWEQMWADEAAGERAAEAAMWRQLETNDEHFDEMVRDDLRLGVA